MGYPNYGAQAQRDYYNQWRRNSQSYNAPKTSPLANSPSGRYYGGGAVQAQIDSPMYAPYPAQPAPSPASPTGPVRTSALAVEPKAPQPGLLSTPGAYEQWYEQNKDALNAATQGEQFLNKAGGYFDQGLGGGGYFLQPSYAEQLYESGNQGLNTFYDRERDKRQKRLEDQMSAMGVFGSGATARGMFELESELGAQQARDMADLAAKADNARISRLGEQRSWISGLTNAGTAGDNAANARFDRGAGAAQQAQSFFQDRVRLPLKDKMDLATQMAPIVQDALGKSAEEQAKIKMELIQTYITEGGMDRAAAEQYVEEMFKSAGNFIRTQK